MLQWQIKYHEPHSRWAIRMAMVLLMEILKPPNSIINGKSFKMLFHCPIEGNWVWNTAYRRLSIWDEVRLSRKPLLARRKLSRPTEWHGLKKHFAINHVISARQKLPFHGLISLTFVGHLIMTLTPVPFKAIIDWYSWHHDSGATEVIISGENNLLHNIPRRPI